MSEIHLRRRFAFTLIELLVVMAIIALLIALLLPAVQSIRETAAKTACMNNMKQIGVALTNYHTSHGSFPYSHVYSTTPNYKATHGWGALILPELDQEALSRSYRLDKNWNDPLNQPVVTIQLKVFQCPSAEPNRADQVSATVTSAASDYGPPAGVNRTLATSLGYATTAVLDGVIQYPPRIPPLPSGAETDPNSHKSTRYSDITDGVSRTIMVAEDAGRPAYWLASGLQGNASVNPGSGKEQVTGGRVQGAGWADEKNDYTVYGVKSTNLNSAVGPCVINCSNNNEIYAFHRGGVNILMADGSVKFITTSTQPQIVIALITKAGQDSVTGIDD